MTIAKVLHLAADRYLTYNHTNYENYPYFMNKYSCCAIDDAIDDDELFTVIMEGLKEMGCNTDSTSLYINYKDSHTFQEIQGMRYMWLKWAALMAEEQGV